MAKPRSTSTHDTPPRTSRSRLLTLVVVVAAVGAPAAVMRGLCVGHSCDETEDASSEVPFCSLPAQQRELVAAGFEGELHRSPDLLGVTRADVVVRGGSAFSPRSPQPAWPATDSDAPRVPLVFWGAGIEAGGTIPGEVGLDDVAPTIEEVIGFRRPHPNVRSGEGIEGIASGDKPALVVEIVLKDLSSEEIESGSEDWGNLQRLMDEGHGTFDANTGSLPNDPAAVLTTIGTGGLPHQHGMVGTLVRSDGGGVVRAWGPRSPVHIIATLADDLDVKLGQKPLIGLVGNPVSDRGLIGGNWYLENDEDEIATEPEDPVAAVERMLSRGFGRDEVPDVLAVVLEGETAVVDDQVGAITSLMEDRLAGKAAVVVTATGGQPPTADLSAARVETLVEDGLPGSPDVVAATAPGGIYLDLRALAAAEITEDDVLKVFRGLETPDGRTMFADTFPAIAVSFARYC